MMLLTTSQTPPYHIPFYNFSYLALYHTSKGLLNASGGVGPAEVPLKRRYVFLDCQRLAIVNNM
ncbi:hypothetical protein EON63_24845 [archaeon]|nr:MAG: hypothetical protein EON63_24845 [archaeon]